MFENILYPKKACCSLVKANDKKHLRRPCIPFLKRFLHLLQLHVFSFSDLQIRSSIEDC